MNDYQKMIHLSRYARYNSFLERRETWEETVDRYCDFFLEKYPETFPYASIQEAIFNMDVMPSMRALMSAGGALERDHMAGYNCSYLPIESLRDFDEILYILMCGTGVGFSVERQYINKLPDLPEDFHASGTIINVADSKIGWASAFRELLALLFSGKVPKWDVSGLRPSGSPLKVFGGRSSGPAPLVSLFNFAVELCSGARGRRLNSLEVHDLVCKIAEVVVVGGVRRSALISLSNLTDERMREAKTGAWWEKNGQRRLANNSVAYTEKPDMGIFMREWESLYGSKSGERGIFNRNSAVAKSKANGRRSTDFDFGTNPCGEIILRPRGLCNLSEVVIREHDNEHDLIEKVKWATIIGTFQSTLTNFRYVRNIWKRNAEEERLLGVSLTGITDNARLCGEDTQLLQRLREVAIATNLEWANRLGVAPSAAITTVKPSGTVSQLVDSSSGIHPRYSEFYLRAVRMDKKDPLALFMREKQFPVEDDVTDAEHTDVFFFPQKSPNQSLVRSDLTAIDQLEQYVMFRENWCEHNPSITVQVKEHEWMEVGAFVYRGFHHMGGVSFLPYDTGIYQQAPYQEITEEKYQALSDSMPKEVDWTEMKEETDKTTATQELACFAGGCEI